MMTTASSTTRRPDASQAGQPAQSDRRGPGLRGPSGDRGGPGRHPPAQHPGPPGGCPGPGGQRHLDHHHRADGGGGRAPTGAPSPPPPPPPPPPAPVDLARQMPQVPGLFANPPTRAPLGIAPEAGADFWVQLAYATDDPYWLAVAQTARSQQFRFRLGALGDVNPYR